MKNDIKINSHIYILLDDLNYNLQLQQLLLELIKLLNDTNLNVIFYVYIDKLKAVNQNIKDKLSIDEQQVLYQIINRIKMHNKLNIRFFKDESIHLSPFKEFVAHETNIDKPFYLLSLTTNSNDYLFIKNFKNELNSKNNWYVTECYKRRCNSLKREVHGGKESVPRIDIKDHSEFPHYHFHYKKKKEVALNLIDIYFDENNFWKHNKYNVLRDDIPNCVSELLIKYNFKLP